MRLVEKVLTHHTECERSPLPETLSDVRLGGPRRRCAAKMGHRGTALAPLGFPGKAAAVAKVRVDAPIPKSIVFRNHGKSVLRGEVIRADMSTQSRAELSQLIKYLSDQGVSDRDLRAIRRLYQRGFAISSVVPTSGAAPSRLARNSRRGQRYKARSASASSGK